MPNQRSHRPRSSSFEESMRKLSDKALSRHSSDASSYSVNKVADVGSLLSLMAPSARLRPSSDDTNAVKTFMGLLGRSSEVGSVSSITLEGHEAQSADNLLTPAIMGTSETSNDPAPLTEIIELPEENVFDYSGEDDTINISTDKDALNFLVDIRTWSKDGESLYMRALLDTGMDPNVIREEKAIETGYEMERHDGRSFVTAAGTTFTPTRCVKLQWRFHKSNNLRHEKTYTIKFLVVPDDVPFDVVIGRIFIQKAKLFVPNPNQWIEPAMILTPKPQTREEKEETKRKKEAQRKRSEKEEQQYLKESANEDNSKAHNQQQRRP